MRLKNACRNFAIATASLALLATAFHRESLAQGTLPPSTYSNWAPPLPITSVSPAYIPLSSPTPHGSPILDSLLREYPNSQEDHKKQIAEQITKIVQQEFDARHAAQKQELNELEDLLARKKKAFEKRDSLKEKIVSDRVASLIERAEGTGWELPSGPTPPVITPPSWSAVPMPLPNPTPAIQPIPSPPSPSLPLPSLPPSEFVPPAPQPENSNATVPNPRRLRPEARGLFGTPMSQVTFPLIEPIAPPSYPKARVSYEDFKELVAEVEPHRQARIIGLDQFLEMSKQPGVMILDTRSDFRYERIHIQGAKHLSFTDFTQANLANVIPSPETTILIYCNNNFDGNQVDFASKSAPPRPRGNRVIESQVASQNKPVQLALNVPTYINLYGYGYRNVFELGELVKVTDPRVAFEGSMVNKDK